MYEINLVPDVKKEMIKAQKTRNITLFFCFIASVAAVVLALVFIGIKTGQDLAISGQDKQMSAMSKKINEYDGMNEILTVQAQLNKMSEIAENKTVLSRIFNVFSVLLPSGADRVTLSELNINVATGVLSFDAQADAGEAPYIDYRVLEAFKKSVSLMKYDFGRYVDEEGNEIPTICIQEADQFGNAFTERGRIYAKWAKNVKGCDPAKNNSGDEEEAEEQEETDELAVTEEGVTQAILSGDFETIWRTPIIASNDSEKGWYDAGYMDLDGTIKGVQHFESQCSKYTGNVVGKKIQWVVENECYLAPEGVDISGSSNGKDENDELVLRFSANIKLDENIFKFQNKHLLAIAPTGRQNVTDSYTQIDSIFGKPASDCLAGDASCDNAINQTGEEE